MAEYLVWSLTANLGAMGELAGNEYRPTMRYPGKSALIGMMGAALGIARSDEEGQEKLRSLEVAVAIFNDGTPMRDFHTVQTVNRKSKHSPITRADALSNAGSHLETMITQREYRQNVHYGIAGWHGDLEAIRDAIENPVYPIYLGRKSCSLSSPADPQIVSCDTLEDAFQTLKNPPWMTEPAVAREMVTDASLGLEGSQEWRNDIPLSRTRWEFANRQVTVSPIHIELEMPA